MSEIPEGYIAVPESAWHELVQYELRCQELAAQVEVLKGIKPQVPPRPPFGCGLPRYGINWNGPKNPLAVQMDDGYWTPYHLVQQHLAEIRAQAVEYAADQLANLITAPPGLHSSAVVKLNRIADSIRQEK